MLLHCVKVKIQGRINEQASSLLLWAVGYHKLYEKPRLVRKSGSAGVRYLGKLCKAAL